MIEERKITDRDQWLEWRRQDVTASAIGALFDLHPYVSHYRLYQEKKTRADIPPKNESMLRGRRWFEAAVAEAVRELRPEWRIEPAKTYLRDPDLRLGATPDFFIHDDPRGLGVLQCKTAAPSVFERDWSDGAVPMWITLQAVVEQWLAKAQFGAVAVLSIDAFASDARIVELPPPDAAVQCRIAKAVIEFWDDIAAGNEPSRDYERDKQAIIAAHPRSLEGTEVDFGGDNELPHKLARRAILKDLIKESDAECEAIDNEIRARMGDCEKAIGVPGWSITWKTGFKKGYEVKDNPNHRPLLIKPKKR